MPNTRNAEMMSRQWLSSVLKEWGFVARLENVERAVAPIPTGGGTKPVDSDDIDDAVGSIYVKADGTVAFTADQSMGDNQLTNVGTPSADTDACTKGYADSIVPSGNSGQTYWSAAQLYTGALTAHQTVLTVAGATGDVAGLTVIIPTLAGSGNVTFTLYAYETSNGGRTTTIKWSSAALTDNTDWSGVSLASLTSGSRTVDGTEELHAFVHTLARTSLTAGNLLNLVVTCDSLKIVGLKIDW